MTDVKRTFEPPAWLGIATDITAYDVIGEPPPPETGREEFDRLIRQLDSEPVRWPNRYVAIPVAIVLLMLVLILFSRPTGVDGTFRKAHERPAVDLRSR